MQELSTNLQFIAFFAHRESPPPIRNAPSVELNNQIAKHILEFNPKFVTLFFE